MHWSPAFVKFAANQKGFQRKTILRQKRISLPVSTGSSKHKSGRFSIYFYSYSHKLVKFCSGSLPWGPMTLTWLKVFSELFNVFPFQSHDKVSNSEMASNDKRRNWPSTWQWSSYKKSKTWWGYSWSRLCAKESLRDELSASTQKNCFGDPPRTIRSC